MLLSLIVTNRLKHHTLMSLQNTLMYGILIIKVLFALEIFLEIFLNYQRKQKIPFSKHKFIKKLGFQREFI